MTCEKWQHHLLKAIKPPDAINKLFAFKHSAYCKDYGNHCNNGNPVHSSIALYPQQHFEIDHFNNLMTEEFDRMEMKKHGWKMTDVNSSYE